MGAVASLTHTDMYTYVYNLNFQLIASNILFVLYNYASVTHLQNKTEKNSSWERAFYESEWVKINSSWIILVFSIHACYY